MLTFIKYLLQLILSPGRGWEDIEANNPDPEVLLAKGLYPLLGLTAATEFLVFIWSRHAELGNVLMRALADFGSYFIALFIARLIFELYLRHFTAGQPDERRAFSVIIFGIGLMVLIQIISNCIPVNIVVLKFLPLYVVLVLYKAAAYLDVRHPDVLRFTGLAAGTIVVVPLLIYYLLYLIIA